MLLGSRFKIRYLTDHKRLECLTNAKEMAGRMARWAMIMSEYNYQVEHMYIKGVTNIAADALNRLISIKDHLWRPLTISAEDSDDDLNHPFLMLWPDVHLALTAHQYCAAVAAVIRIEEDIPADNRDLFLKYIRIKMDGDRG